VSFGWGIASSPPIGNSAERPYKEKPRCGRGLRLTMRHLKSPVSPSNPIHNADDCGKDYEGSGTEIVNASPAAVLLCFAVHGRRIRVLHFKPIGRAAGTVGGIFPLRDDAFEAQLAGMGEHGRQPSHRLNNQREAAWSCAPRSSGDTSSTISGKWCVSGHRRAGCRAGTSSRPSGDDPKPSCSCSQS
jgi:hypothetical protein